MSQKLIRIAFRKLRRNEQQSFNQMVVNCIEKTCGPCGKPYQAFLNAAEQFKALLSKRVQNLPSSLAKDDKKVDKSWNAFYLQLRASQAHPYADVADAANRVAVIFDNIKNPVHLNYERQYGALQILIDGLSALDPAVMTKAQLSAQWDSLRDSFEAFSKARAAKLEAKKERSSGEIEDAVQACSDAWIKLANYLEAKDDADELTGAGEAIALLNHLFASIEARMKARNTRNKKKASDSDAVKESEADQNVVEDALKESSAEE